MKVNEISPVVGPKKAAIVSYGTRITLDSKNVRSVDLLFMRDYLLNVLGRSEVDYVSLKGKKDTVEYYKNIEDTDLNDYDEVYCYNCADNVFGGLFKYEALQTFEKLYDFNGDIYYLFADPALECIDFSRYIIHKMKFYGYLKCDRRKLDFKYDGKIDIDFCNKWREKVYKNMKIAFAGKNYQMFVDKYHEALKQKTRLGRPLDYILEHHSDWFNFQLFEYYAVNEKLDLKMKDYDHSLKEYDLVYFGNQRPSERNKTIKSLYNDTELKKLFVGYDPNMENTTVTDYVAHDELFNIIGEKCWATVVVGDLLHNDNICTTRFFEAMLLDTVGFIYIDFDPNKEYIQNDFLKDFIYIHNSDELKTKINQIKSDNDLYNKIVELERQEIKSQFGKYINK